MRCEADAEPPCVSAAIRIRQLKSATARCRATARPRRRAYHAGPRRRPARSARRGRAQSAAASPHERARGDRHPCGPRSHRVQPARRPDLPPPPRPTPSRARPAPPARPQVFAWIEKLLAWASSERGGDQSTTASRRATDAARQAIGSGRPPTRHPMPRAGESTRARPHRPGEAREESEPVRVKRHVPTVTRSP
jgi:hypothetical protein